MRKTRLKCFARGFVPLRTSATKSKNYPSTSLSGAEATASQHSSMGCLQPSNQGFRFPQVDGLLPASWEVGEKFSPFFGGTSSRMTIFVGKKPSGVPLLNHQATNQSTI